MCVLNPQNLLASLPVPKIERFVLRPTHYLVGCRVKKNCNCMLMLGKFTYYLSAREVPDDGLPIPRTSYYVLSIDEIDG